MPRAASVVFDHLVNADPPAHPRILFDTGCVLGGSVAGLLAARTLADFCRQVVIVERDELSEQSSRPGVPQGHQLHVLLPAGGQWLHRWLPGFTDQAVARGANRITSDVKSLDGQPMVPPYRQYEMLSATRPLLETVVRSEVLARANISVKRAQATGLRYRDGAVTGVEFVDRAGVGVCQADFVVDATGRSSRISRWVEEAGFDRPRLERLALPIHYATAIFESTEESATLEVDGWLSIFSPGNEVDGVSIAAAARVESGRWVVCLIGCGSEQPGHTLDDFLAKCKQLEPVFATVTAGQLCREVTTYHQTESRRRHFTELTDFPARLVCVGDSVASFNPVYGQGMSSAALHASCLSTYLSDAGDFDSAAHPFFRLQQVVVDAAWQLSTGGDRARLDFLTGATIAEATRMQRWTHDQIARATLTDRDLAELYTDVQYMLRHPSALAHPAILERAVVINLTAS
ncbi:NAD(P)/FAD-dependent oxidoreductase [Mycobacterium simiae]|uniref:NAD(P)/FAD-dependent oxidoreductase n=1 Tax=Mycobacterium simiae TaxID=1784 RepID=UPI0026223152|nr:FAD-dependent monooxygenase [Mycobacterium simiae]